MLLREQLRKWDDSLTDYQLKRMMGDYHVRFCERLGVKFPLPTRPRGQSSGHRTFASRALAHLLAAHFRATPKQAKEPTFATLDWTIKMTGLR
ncbi:MAG: hypothetical protein ACKOC0_15865, partial [Cytophagales bacterium]